MSHIGDYDRISGLPCEVTATSRVYTIDTCECEDVVLTATCAGCKRPDVPLYCIKSVAEARRAGSYRVREAVACSGLAAYKGDVVYLILKDGRQLTLVVMDECADCMAAQGKLTPVCSKTFCPKALARVVFPAPAPLASVPDQPAPVESVLGKRAFLDNAEPLSIIGNMLNVVLEHDVPGTSSELSSYNAVMIDHIERLVRSLTDTSRVRRHPDQCEVPVSQACLHRVSDIIRQKDNVELSVAKFLQDSDYLDAEHNCDLSRLKPRDQWILVDMCTFEDTLPVLFDPAAWAISKSKMMDLCRLFEESGKDRQQAAIEAALEGVDPAVSSRWMIGDTICFNRCPPQVCHRLFDALSV